MGTKIKVIIFVVLTFVGAIVMHVGCCDGLC